MWTEKASAHSPELVQMFDVAFSRRMCCSRVESVSTKPRLPRASTVCPQRPPGLWAPHRSAAPGRAALAARVARLPAEAARHLAHRLFARREKAERRSAEARRHAEALRLAAHDVRAALA